MLLLRADSCLILHDSMDPMEACQTPLSMEFPRQEYWSGLPLPSSGDLPDPGILILLPALQADSLQVSHLGSPSKSSLPVPDKYLPNVLILNLKLF